MIGGADRAPARLAATRAGWHRVAEHMPAAALYRATGHTGLVRSPGGFRAPSFGTDGRSRAVDGSELVVSGAAGTKRTPLITVRAAAEFAGIMPGTPAGVSGHAAPPGLDAPLLIEPGAARLLAEWHGLGAQALSRGDPRRPAGRPRAVARAFRCRHDRCRDQPRRLTRRRPHHRSVPVRRPAPWPAAGRSGILERPVRGRPHLRPGRHRGGGGGLVW